MTRPTVGLVAIAAAALLGCGEDSPSALPAVVLPALEGFPQEASELDTGDLDGPAVLNFWATWCYPCRTELPVLQRASAEYPNVRFVGVDDGFAPAESVAFLDDFGVTYDQFVDADGALAEELEISGLPATVVLDADGEIVARESGALSYDELLAALDNVEL